MLDGSQSCSSAHLFLILRISRFPIRQLYKFPNFCAPHLPSSRILEPLLFKFPNLHDFQTYQRFRSNFFLLIMTSQFPNFATPSNTIECHQIPSKAILLSTSYAFLMILQFFNDFWMTFHDFQ